jgi:hypothetical protein
MTEVTIDVSRFRDEGEWCDGARKRGYSVPTAAGHALSRARRTFGWSFQEAYAILVKEELLFLYGRTYLVRPDAVEALRDKYPPRAEPAH